MESYRKMTDIWRGTVGKEHAERDAAFIEPIVKLFLGWVPYTVGPASTTSTQIEQDIA